MVAFNRRMPAGIPGEINRAQAATVETVAITLNPATGYLSAYGLPGVIDATSGKFRMVAAGDKSVYGLFARPYPFQGNGTDGLGTTTPPAAPYTSGLGDVLRRGYMSVLLNGTTPAAKGGAVYVRLTNAAGGKPIGGFEAAPDFAQVAAGAGGGGSNTGNGTVTAITGGSNLKPGAYGIKFTGATAYNVTDPDGNLLASVTALGAYTNGEIGWTVTAGGTPFAAGDGFTITSNHLKLSSTTDFNGPADASGNVEIGFNI